MASQGDIAGDSNDVSSRLATAAPHPIGPPVHEIVGGSSVRQYLNQHLTKHLLDGLKQVGHEKPDDPLLFLGEYLISKSKETNPS